MSADIRMPDAEFLRTFADMKYLRASLRIACAEETMDAARDLLADALGEVGFESFEYTEQGLEAYIQEALHTPGSIEGCIADFVLENVAITYTLAPVADKDWNAEWEQQGFDPIVVGGQLWVYDAKRPADAEAPYPVRIAIDARQAFGTGTHETTRMVLSMLIGAGVGGRRVLDCGCGTGILSIAAARLGAATASAYDIDPWSVDNTRHNAALNGVETAVSVSEGDASLIDTLGGGYDVVMANINRNILLADMPRFRQAMAADGTLILSGFYHTDIPMLAEKAGTLGLEMVRETREGDWAAIELKVSLYI